jgi:protein gp37
MGQNSKIAWTHATFNAWRGCTKIDAACLNCYADKMSVRNPNVLGVWGPRGTRVVASESYWRQPLKWDAAAKAAGERRRVFCASLADVFEGPETMPLECVAKIGAARVRLFALIESTPSLDWLLLTKRPENMKLILPAKWLDEPQPNAWLGVTAGDPKGWDNRVPILLNTPAAVRFVSVEPMLEAIDCTLSCNHECAYQEPDTGAWVCQGCEETPALDLVICGCESGPRRRPMKTEWAISLRKQCFNDGIAFFMKQMEICGKVTDDPAQFPKELRVREMPTPRGGKASEK